MARIGLLPMGTAAGLAALDAVLRGPEVSSVAAALTEAKAQALTAVARPTSLEATVAGGSLVFLALLGGLSARVCGASIARGAGRVTLWGALAMAATAAIGSLFGAVGI